MTKDNDKPVDGGAAFPLMPPVATDGFMPAGYPYPEPGMTLRDYFAAKAMAAMIGSELIMRHTDQLMGDPEFHRGNWVASQAYGFADSMLAARTTGSAA